MLKCFIKSIYLVAAVTNFYSAMELIKINQSMPTAMYLLALAVIFLTFFFNENNK